MKRLLIVLIILVGSVSIVSSQIDIPDNQNKIIPGGIHDIWPDQWPYYIIYHNFIYPCLPDTPPNIALEICVKPVDGGYPYPFLSGSGSGTTNTTDTTQHSSTNSQPNGPTVQYSPPEPLTYVVERGDNWYSIARKFDVSVEALWDVNGIEDPNAHIHKGNVFVIP